MIVTYLRQILDSQLLLLLDVQSKIEILNNIYFDWHGFGFTYKGHVCLQLDYLNVMRQTPSKY